jgi:hypothetical protein
MSSVRDGARHEAFAFGSYVAQGLWFTLFARRTERPVIKTTIVTVTTIVRVTRGRSACDALDFEGLGQFVPDDEQTVQIPAAPSKRPRSAGATR